MSVTSNGTWGTRLLAGSAVVAGLCFSANAQAVQLGVGLMAGAGGNFIEKPDPFSILSPYPGLQPNPGFGGATFGGGLALDLRILPFIGLELDILRKSDKGTGTYNNVDFTIGGGATHVPILAKFLLPSPLVAPFAILGGEFVSPSDGDAEAKANGITAPVPQWANSYWMFTFGLGMEIKLPLPVVDIRIPISLRGSITPGASSDAIDRSRPTATPGLFSYNAEWQYAFSLNAGAQIYFF
jgi:hypothetical protein